MFSRLLAIIVGSILMVVLFGVLVAAYEKRRTIGLILLNILMLPPMLLVLTVLSLPFGVVHVLLKGIERAMTADKERQVSPLLNEVFQFNAKNGKALGMLLDSDKMRELNEKLSAKVTEAEKRESKDRSLKAFLKNQNTIEVEVAWDSANHNKPLTMQAYKKGTYPRKKEVVWNLEEGIVVALKDRFIPLSLEKQDAVVKGAYQSGAVRKGECKELVSGNKGSGMVFYREGTLQLQFENMKTFLHQNFSASVPFEVDHPYFGSKEERRGGIYISSGFDRTTFHDYQLHIYAEYGDEYKMPQQEQDQLQQRTMESLKKMLNVAIPPCSRLLKVEAGRLSVTTEGMGKYTLWCRGIVHLEITEQKTEVLYG